MYIVDALLRTTEHSGGYSYYLYYDVASYSWERAKQQCAEDGTHIVNFPYPSAVTRMVENYNMAYKVWLSDTSGRCLTLKKGCKRVRNSRDGEGIVLINFMKFYKYLI